MCGSPLARSVYQVLYKDPVTGERKYLSKGGFERKKDCILAASEVEKQIHDNTYIEERKVTFKDFALESFDRVRETSKKT